jgi:hypothetical protein
MRPVRLEPTGLEPTGAEIRITSYRLVERYAPQSSILRVQPRRSPDALPRRRSACRSYARREDR